MTPATDASPLLLWGRALVLSVMGLLTGAVAHVQADGLLPGPGVLLAVVAVGALAVAPMLRREVSTPRMVALVIAGQSAVHLVLAITAGHRGDPSPVPAPALAQPAAPATSPPSTGRSGSYFDVAYAPHVDHHGGGLSVPAPLVHAFSDVGAHPMMALAHLLAAAACAWYLAQGERALWALLSMTARGWVAIFSPVRWRWSVPTLDRRGAIPDVGEVERGPRMPFLARSVTRRGPPRVA